MSCVLRAESGQRTQDAGLRTQDPYNRTVTVQTPTSTAAESQPAITLNDLLVYMARQEASDLHLKPMRPPLVRIRGKLVPIKTDPLKPADLEKMLLPILNRPQKEKFDSNQSVDFGYGVPGVARFRANLYMQRGTVGAVFRRIPIQVIGLDALEMPIAIQPWGDYYGSFTDKYGMLWMVDYAEPKEK